MNAHRRLWLGLGTLLLLSFSVLLWMGAEIHRKAPPLPAQVLSEDGTVLYTAADIERGRQVWQSMGGMQLGSIWGHGGYVAPDWSADWLHREASRGARSVGAARGSGRELRALRRTSGAPLARAARNAHAPRTRTTRRRAPSRSMRTARPRSGGRRALSEPIRQRPRHRRSCAKRTR